MSSNPVPPIPNAEYLTDLINRVQARLEDLEVTEGHWYTLFRDTANEVKRLLEMEDRLEQEDNDYKLWFREMEEIGTTSRNEPSKGCQKVLEEMATTTSGYPAAAECARQTQADLCQLAETINRCLDHFRSKSSLAKQISNGLKVTCADNGEQMALQPLSNIPEWRGETARRTLWDMTQARLIATSQKHAGDNDEEQEEEQKANNKGSTSGCT